MLIEPKMSSGGRRAAEKSSCAHTYKTMPDLSVCVRATGRNFREISRFIRKLERCSSILCI